MVRIQIDPPHYSQGMSYGLYVPEDPEGGEPVKDIPEDWDDDVKEAIARFAREAVIPAYIRYKAGLPHLDRGEVPAPLKMTIPEEL